MQTNVWPTMVSLQVLTKSVNSVLFSSFFACYMQMKNTLWACHLSIHMHYTWAWGPCKGSRNSEEVPELSRWSHKMLIFSPSSSSSLISRSFCSLATSSDFRESPLRFLGSRNLFGGPYNRFGSSCTVIWGSPRCNITKITAFALLSKNVIIVEKKLSF